MPPSNKIEWLEVAAIVAPTLFVILVVALLIAG